MLPFFVRHFRSVSVFIEQGKMSGEMQQQQQMEDVKAESSEHINLKVAGQDGSVVHFKIKKNTPLRKLMAAYCTRVGIQSSQVRFRFDGNPINETDSPSLLEMEDGDSIDVFQQQTGGNNH